MTWQEMYVFIVCFLMAGNWGLMIYRMLRLRNSGPYNQLFYISPGAIFFGLKFWQDDCPKHVERAYYWISADWVLVTIGLMASLYLVPLPD